MTTRCLDAIYENSTTQLEIIIIDNGSDTPLRYQQPESTLNHRYRYIKNKKNIGAFPALQQGFDVANGDLIVFLHNDVLIHEYAWDERVQSVFDNDEDVALAGFFGSRAIDLYGAKIDTISNMKGLELGDDWSKHSSYFTGEAEVISLDSLSMIFRTEYLDKIKMDDLPPHHWFDRIIAMRYHDTGYKVMVIGIAFDHSSVGKSTYTVHRDEFEEFCREWCERHGVSQVPDDDSWDNAVAAYGQSLWMEIWKPKIIEKMKLHGSIDFSYRLLEHVDDFSLDELVVLEYNMNRFL